MSLRLNGSSIRPTFRYSGEARLDRTASAVCVRLGAADIAAVVRELAGLNVAVDILIVRSRLQL